jgi:ATP-dependent Clp endopeptidase proteolytic subunit ClpP|tara:strand:+ start:10620 stop:11651 length:1032 start_codon:yes stop_codon:yes gene_type:complete
MNNKWYNIQGKATDAVAEIYIFDEIGAYGITAQDFIAEMKEYKDTPVNLRINCIGGDVFDGMAMYNIIKKREAKTTAYIEGIAASMGSVIALAADEVVMAENSLFMIHNAWGGAMGGAEDMRKTASVLEKISNEIANIYKRKTRLSLDRITDMMDEETWLNAEEAYELGFIDSISDSIKVAAKYDVSKFKNITTEQIHNKLNINVNNKKMTEELKNWFNNKVDEIVASVKGADNKSEEVVTEVNVMLSDNEEISNKLSSFEASVTDLNGKIVSLEEELTSAKGENETLSTEIERLNALLNKADAKGTEVVTEGDPAVVENKTVDANASFYNAMAERVRAKFNN